MGVLKVFWAIGGGCEGILGDWGWLWVIGAGCTI